LAPAIDRGDGMPRLELILLPSASAGGYNAQRLRQRRRRPSARRLKVLASFEDHWFSPALAMLAASNIRSRSFCDAGENVVGAKWLLLMLSTDSATGIVMCLAAVILVRREVSVLDSFVLS